MESNSELLARHKHVTDLYNAAVKKAKRLKSGGSRDRAMRWAGSLNFTKIQCESEIERRGLFAKELVSALAKILT